MKIFIISFIATGALVIAFLVLWLGVLNPKQSVSVGAEAVVVFAGGSGERFDLGLDLVKAHKTKYILLSVGAVDWTDRQRLLEYCSAKHESPIVICVKTELEADNTLGEAKLFAEKAKMLDLKHLVAVSGKSHAYRASLRLSQNFEGIVDRMGAAEKVTMKSLAHEWLGIIHAKITG